MAKEGGGEGGKKERKEGVEGGRRDWKGGREREGRKEE